MSYSGNALADRYEAQDQRKCAEQDAFQAWFEENQNTLREDFSAGLSDEEELKEDEFMEWAQGEFEKESK